MTFKIIITKFAEQDINIAIDYYFNQVKSPASAENFYHEVTEAFNAISINPFYRFYNNRFRGKPLQNFPYIVFFDIHENTNTVEILGVFNTNQDTSKYPNQ